MGVPTSEVGYTPAMPRREDHEVHKGHVVALENIYIYIYIYLDLINTRKMERIKSTNQCAVRIKFHAQKCRSEAENPLLYSRHAQICVPITMSTLALKPVTYPTVSFSGGKLPLSPSSSFPFAVHSHSLLQHPVTPSFTYINPYPTNVENRVSS